MGDERRSISLREASRWLSGGTPSKANPSYWKGDIPWISASNLKSSRVSSSTNNISREGLLAGSNLAPKGSVLLLVRGSELFNRIPIGVAQREVAFNQDIKCLVPRTDLFREDYFYYSLVGNTEYLVNAVEATGIGAGKLDSDVIGKLQLPLVPRIEQEAIAHILGTLDDKIELLRQMNETLEAMARALFKSWFVDFDPVRKKADGLPTGLPKDVEDLFPSEFEDSDLGEIPKGWKVGELSTISFVNPESWSDSRHPQTLVYVDLSSVKNGEILSTDSYTFGSAPSRARKVLRLSDTIIGTVRPGNRSFAFIDRDGLTGSTGFAVLRAKVPIFAEWVYLASTSDDMIDLYEHNADGGAYPAISSGFIARQTFCIPPESIVDSFHSVATFLFKHMAVNSGTVNRLSDLRDSLLPKLISGDLELTDEMIAKILEPAK